MTMKYDDVYEHYKNIPCKERNSGVFSDSSIKTHHIILKNIFLKSLKKKLLISSINYTISFGLVALVIVGFCKNHHAPLVEAAALFWFFLYLWIFTFTIMAIIRISAYPTRKHAMHDLELISAVEDELNNRDFIA